MRSMSVHNAALYQKSRIRVPIRDGGGRWREAAAALHDGVPDPTMVAVVDSSSTDGSDTVAASFGIEVERIDPRTFNHGCTRQAAVDRFCQDRDFAVFLTHDAVIEGPRSLIELLDAFSNPQVGAAYGRQVSRVATSVPRESLAAELRQPLYRASAPFAPAAKEILLARRPGVFADHQVVTMQRLR